MIHLHRVLPLKKLFGKVLFVTPEFGWGGMGLHSLRVVNFLRDSGYEVTVYTTKESRDITFRSYPNMHIRAFINVMYGFRNFHPLFDLLSVQHTGMERNFDLLIRTMPPFYFYMPSLRYHPIPEITIVHDTFHDLINVYKNGSPKDFTGKLLLSKLSTPLLLSEKAYLNRARRIVAVSNYTKRKLEYWYGIDRKRIEVIHNFVDTRQFKKTTQIRSDIGRKVRDFKKDALLLAFVGTRGVVKNFGLFYDIVKSLFDQKLKFVVIGLTKGDLGVQFEKIDNVLFLGYVDNRIMPEIYSLIDLLVMTSISENLPSVLLEAMACGVIPVSTNVGGIREVVQNGSNGFLVSSNKSAFVETLHKVVRLRPSELEKLSCNAIASVRKKFDIIYARNKFVNLIERLINQNEET